MTLVNGTDKHGSWKGVIPPQNYLGKTLFKIEAKDSKNRAFYPSEDGFVEIPILDAIPPVLSFNHVEMVSAAKSYRINVHVRDNVLVGGVSCNVFTQGDEPYWLDMKLQRGNTQDGLWSCNIGPTKKVVETRFVIYAHDVFGNNASLPLLGEFLLKHVDPNSPVMIKLEAKDVMVNQTIIIDAYMMDDLGITEVTVYHKLKGDQHFSSTPMNLFKGNNRVGQYHADILGKMENGTLEFYILASDGSNTLRYPSGAGLLSLEIQSYPVMEIDTDEGTPPSPFPWDRFVLILMASAVLFAVGYEAFRRLRPKSQGAAVSD